MMEVRVPIVWMGWHPAGLSVCLPAVIFPLHQKTQKMACITREFPNKLG